MELSAGNVLIYHNAILDACRAIYRSQQLIPVQDHLVHRTVLRNLTDVSVRESLFATYTIENNAIKNCSGRLPDR